MPGPRFPKPPTRKFSFITRNQAVRGAARALERHGWPRFQMLMIVSVTGLSGFIASVLLLYFGVEQMAARYPLAIGIAYLAFLFMLFVWLRTGDEPSLDGLDFPGGGGHGGAGPGGFDGAGGGFGGAGASGGWEPAAGAADSAVTPLEGVGDSFGSAADVAVADEGCLVIAVVLVVAVVIGGLFLSAIYLVWGAPVLMGELLVDAALSYGLYRNLRRQDRDYWLWTALRRTAWLFALTAILASAAGVVLVKLAPGARSLGEVMELRRDKP